jgi:hypothetical protein
MSLIDFYAHFEASADSTLKQLWRYEEFDTKFGPRRELRFVGDSLIFIEIPPNGALQFMAMQTKDVRLYRHGQNMLHSIADFYLQNAPSLQVRVFGLAYQSIVGLSGFHVETLNSVGHIAGTDRFGNLTEIEVKSIAYVTLSKEKK